MQKRKNDKGKLFSEQEEIIEEEEEDSENLKDRMEWKDKNRHELKL